MTAPRFDAYLIADWSAAATPRRGKDSIWWALWRRDGGLVALCNPATRHAAMAEIADALAGERAAGRRVLAGFDFPFGYPAGTAAALFGASDWSGVWQALELAVADAPDNANTRFAAAATLNARGGRFWGHPGGHVYPGLPTRKPLTGALGEFRVAERYARSRGSQPKSVWQLNGAGSVGGQVLTGLPALARLRRDPRLAGMAVWPFETGLAVPDAPIVLAEVYPSLFEVERQGQEPLDAAQVRSAARRFAELDTAGALAAMFAGPALSDADRAAIETQEAWILGLGFEAQLRARGGYERDPARIYAQSFATVRAEARLDRLAPDLAEVAVRLIHACGMIDIADDLVFSDGCIAAGRTALAGGAAILCDCEMVASGIIRRALPETTQVIVTLNDPAVPGLAARLGTTRSAAAVELWGPHLQGAVVAVGNAPTALFHLLDAIARGGPKPALILGFPVGFVGAAESKAALAVRSHGVPFLALRGRRGGSAMAAAAVNALTLGLRGNGQ